MNKGRRPLNPVPRWLRPRLTPDQVRDLSLAHHVNLDAIARGEADESILWQLVGGVLTWSRVAELLRRDVDEMREQLDLVTALVERYRCTGRVLFRGPEYQLARRGVQLMDELATAVDRDTAILAADWSERKVNAMAAAVMEHSTCTS